MPVVAGTGKPTSLEEARAFAGRHGAVMLKAIAGGGGRGGPHLMHSPDEIDEDAGHCGSEARQTVGNADLYVEKRCFPLHATWRCRWWAMARATSVTCGSVTARYSAAIRS